MPQRYVSLRRQRPVPRCARIGAGAWRKRPSTFERLAIEVRPQSIGKKQFGVGEVPQQKVADPLFTPVRMNKSGSGR